MMSDSFIEGVLTLDSQNGDAEMIYREFHGMEAVAKFEEQESTEEDYE